MSKKNFTRGSEFRKKFFPKPFKVPTEKQVQTWENEGGCLNEGYGQAVIINGILCETWLDRIRASLLPLWRNTKMLLKHSK